MFTLTISVILCVLGLFIMVFVIIRFNKKPMMTESQKAALREIQSLIIKIRDEPRQREVRDVNNLIEFVYLPDICPVRENIEMHLEKIDELVKEYNLDSKIALRAKKLALKTIYNAAINKGRKNYVWAAAFAKEHDL